MKKLLFLTFSAIYLLACNEEEKTSLQPPIPVQNTELPVKNDVQTAQSTPPEEGTQKKKVLVKDK